VDTTLEKHKPDIVQLGQEMTPKMKQPQESILEIMDACVEELKRTNLVNTNFSFLFLFG
jgi:DNA excision repair protein ERCC-4